MFLSTAAGFAGAAALGGAVGSIAGQLTGIATGVQEKFSWREVGLAGLAAGVTAGVGSALQTTQGATLLSNFSETGQIAVRSGLSSALTQGLQGKFSWRHVAASALGAAAGSTVSGVLGSTELGKALGPAASLFGGTVGGSVAQRIATGRADIGAVFFSTLGNSLANSLAQNLDSVFGSMQGPQGAWTASPSHEALDNDAGYRLPSSFVAIDNDAPNRNGVQPLEPSLSGSGAALVEDVDPGSVGGMRNLLFVPGSDGPAMIPTSQIGGHFTSKQLVGQPFVDLYSPILGRSVKQADLNFLVALSQVSDQVLAFDAFAAGLRWGNPFSGSWMSAEDGLVQESMHSLNPFGADWNINRMMNLVVANPRDLTLAGVGFHPVEDAHPHEFFSGRKGHVEKGSSVDYMSPELAAKTTPVALKYFEAVFGISADTKLPAQDLTVRQQAERNLSLALDAARETGANPGTAAYERAFNGAAASFLPADSLRLPTLPSFSPSLFFANSREALVAQTRDYVESIGLDVDPVRLLDDLARAYVLIANDYLRLTGGRLSAGQRVDPIDLQRVLPKPTPHHPWYGAP